MKIKENYILKHVAGSVVVVPVGKEALNFNGMITLNASAELLWDILSRGCEKEELCRALVEKYGISDEDAVNDVDDFINSLKGASLLE